MLLSKFSLTFCQNKNGISSFFCIACDYSHADWDILCNHLRDIPWENIFKFSGSAALSEFYEWVQVGIDVYIPHRKYQVKPHSTPCFPTTCAAAIVHRNHFFRLYQHNKYSESKVKFRQASNCCKRVSGAVELAYANKTKRPSLPRNLALGNFGELFIVFSTNENLLYFLYSTAHVILCI